MEIGDNVRTSRGKGKIVGIDNITYSFAMLTIKLSDGCFAGETILKSESEVLPEND